MLLGKSSFLNKSLFSGNEEKPVVPEKKRTSNRGCTDPAQLFDVRFILVFLLLTFRPESSSNILKARSK